MALILIKKHQRYSSVAKKMQQKRIPMAISSFDLGLLALF